MQGLGLLFEEPLKPVLVLQKRASTRGVFWLDKMIVKSFNIELESPHVQKNKTIEQNQTPFHR